MSCNTKTKLKGSWGEIGLCETADETGGKGVAPRGIINASWGRAKKWGVKKTK